MYFLFDFLLFIVYSIPIITKKDYIMNITELENNMTKPNLFRFYASLKTSSERLEFIEIMKNFYPSIFGINWTNVEENVMNEA